MAAVDRFTMMPGATGPITMAFAVTPSDSDELPEVTRALYIRTAGAVRVAFCNGAVFTYPYLAAGRHPIRVAKVFQTGTTATDITGEV